MMTLAVADIHTTVSLLKKNGKEPKRLTVNERAKGYCTDKLYWIFMALGYEDGTLSKFMATRSKYYTCRISWYGFFKNELFMVFDKHNYRGLYSPTMTTEFVRIGTRYIYDLHRNGRFKVKNEEIFG